MRWRTTGLSLIAVYCIAACAVIEKPSGGPEDKAAPRIIGMLPREDSAGVARDVAPLITFSEKVNPSSFKNRVFVFPPVEFDRLKVRGDLLEVAFKNPLPETTMCLLIRAGIEDYHRIQSKQNYLLYFSTADSISRGQVSGFILFKEKPDSTGVAELFAARGDSVINFRTAKRSRVTFAERDGRFSFRALPTDGSKFLLRTFSDRDGDSRYSEGKEFSTLFPDTIVLGPLRDRIEEIRMVIIDPNEPGSIEGRVVNETAFKLAPTVALAPVKPGAKMIAARADTTGKFLLGNVPPGSYILSAFIDLKSDTTCGTYFAPDDSTKALSEPCTTLPDTLRLKPGEIRTLEPIPLK